MPTVRTTCPTCDVVVVDAAELTLRRRPGSTKLECAFVCPDCQTAVSQTISEKMIPVLIGAGCEVEDWEDSDSRALHPSVAGRITETEIVEFILELEREDWMTELLEH